LKNYISIKLIIRIFFIIKLTKNLTLYNYQYKKPTCKPNNSLTNLLTNRTEKKIKTNPNLIKITANHNNPSTIIWANYQNNNKALHHTSNPNDHSTIFTNNYQNNNNPSNKQTNWYVSLKTTTNHTLLLHNKPNNKSINLTISTHG
jgi:hypothetical protein